MQLFHFRVVYLHDASRGDLRLTDFNSVGGNFDVFVSIFHQQFHELEHVSLKATYLGHLRNGDDPNDNKTRSLIGIYASNPAEGKTANQAIPFVLNPECVVKQVVAANVNFDSVAETNIYQRNTSAIFREFICRKLHDLINDPALLSPLSNTCQKLVADHYHETRAPANAGALQPAPQERKAASAGAAAPAAAPDALVIMDLTVEQDLAKTDHIERNSVILVIHENKWCLAKILKPIPLDDNEDKCELISIDWLKESEKTPGLFVEDDSQMDDDYAPVNSVCAILSRAPRNQAEWDGVKKRVREL